MHKALRKLQELVLVNSYTKNKGGVDKVGSIISNIMRDLGYECKVFQREVIGDHLYFTSPLCEGQKILLLGHMDTVFPQGTFEKFELDGDWMYGPGVCDMKGGLIVAIEALEAIKQKFGVIKNIDFLFVSDEETGSDDSKHLTAEIAKEYDYCFVFEAAGKNEELVVARKGIGTFFVDIQGVPSHSGVYFEKGIDANKEAAHKLLALADLTDLSLGTTLNVGVINGGVGANTISPKATLTFEARFRTSDEQQRVLEQVQTIVDTKYIEGTFATLSGGLQRDVMEKNEKQLELISFCESISKQAIPFESRGGVSDANVAAGVGVLTLDGFGPFGDGDHTVNERASLKSFFDRIELCTSIFAYHQEQKKLI